MVKVSKRYLQNEYSPIYEEAPIGICITDENGYFEYVNQAYCNLYGYSKQELRGKHFTIVVPVENKKFMSKMHDRFIYNGEEIEGEWEVINKTGKKLNILANATRIVGDDNRCKKVTYVIDITERKEALADLEYHHEFEELIANMSTDFINVSGEEYDSKINDGLKKVSSFLELDSSAIVLLSSNDDTIQLLYQWLNYNQNNIISLGQRDVIEKSKVQWLIRELKNNSILVVDSVDELPETAISEKEILSDYGIESFVAIPLEDENQIVGTLLFLTWDKKYCWTEDIIRFTKVVSEMFINILKSKWSKEKIEDYTRELEKSKTEVEEAYIRLNNEIKKAERLHRRFLPNTFPECGETDLDFSARYCPAAHIGGDFYNIIRSRNRVIFYLVDIVGHGLDGAMLNIFVRETINRYLLTVDKDSDLTPAKLISFLYKNYQKESFPDDYYICMLLGVYNKNTKKINYSNAGLHIAPIIIKNGEVSRLTSTGLPIASTISSSLYEPNLINQETIEFNKSTTLIMLTDGLIEQQVGSDIYGEERLLGVVKENGLKTPEKIIDNIMTDFKEVTGSEQGEDDITIFVLKKK